MMEYWEFANTIFELASFHSSIVPTFQSFLFYNLFLNFSSTSESTAFASPTKPRSAILKIGA